MSDNESDPRIVRISPEDYETGQSDLSQSDSSDLSENARLWVSSFGNMIFHNDHSNPEERLEDLEGRIFGHSTDADVAYEADSESTYDLDSPPSMTPPRHLPPLAGDDVPSSDDGSLSTVTTAVLSSHVRSLRIEAEDEVNDGEVEDSGMTSSGSFGALSTNNGDDREHQEGTQAIEDHETEVMFRWTLTNMVRQMMFVSGETAEPSIETTTLIEDITRQQVIEIVSVALSPHM